MTSQRTDSARQLRGVSSLLRRLLRGVTYAKASAAIEIMECDPLALEVAEKTRQACQRAAIRRKREDLRTDMSADSLPLDPARVTVFQVEAPRAIPIDSEFVAVVPGRNMRVASGLDIRIHPNRCGSARAVTRRFRDEQVELGGRFHVEKQNARSQRFANLLARLAHAGKDDPVPRHADAPQAVEFSGGNDVKTAAESGEDAQNSKIRIGFDRVADRVRKRA